jgi:hypothetical protein
VLLHVVNYTVFAGISALSVVLVHGFVPETRGKTLEEIELLFGDGERESPGEVELGDAEHLVPKGKG